MFKIKSREHRNSGVVSSGALVHGDLNSSRSSFTSWVENYFMWQRLACDNEKACLVQLEQGVALTARNTTGLSLCAAPGELRCIYAGVSDDDRRR